MRCAVIVLVNCIAARVGPGGLGRGSSLPDITSDLPDEPGLALSQSSDSILDLALQKPPLLPRVSIGAPDPAPPLPPKLARPRFDRSFEDLLAQSYSLQSRALDWPQSASTPRSSQSRSRAQRLIDRTLPSPHGLDTTLPDLELVSASRESLTETDGTSRPPPLHLSPFSWSQSSRDRSNTSSPSLETLSLTSHLSEDPPAVPRKSRLSTPDPTRPFPNRKMSQYDNLPESEAHSLRRSYDTEGCPRLHIPRSDSFPVSPHTTWAKVSFPTNFLGGNLSSSCPLVSSILIQVARARQQGLETPPPLPPKKRNIMSYMEMFGKSVLPSGEDLLQVVGVLISEYLYLSTRSEYLSTCI